MPRATAVADVVHVELKTCPEGWVDLKRMTYGQKLQRRQLLSSMEIRSERGKKGFEGTLQMINEEATRLEFQWCIVDHNLEDESGRKLNLTNVKDIQRLDPKIGEEIETEMGKLNNFEGDDEEGNSEDE